MVILDLSIVNVALPSIQFSLGFTAPDLQWVVDAYAITFAGFLMFGGRAADHFGQRRTFVAALALLGLASLAGGIAPDQGLLIGARAVQGLAGALMAACSLAIITASFERGPKLNRAIGIWAAMNGLGGSAGVLLGGVITEALSWRWVLLINPPIAAAAALVGYAVVRERRRGSDAESFDLAGALMLTLGQIVLVYGVVEAGLKGWDTFAALGPIVVGLLMLGIFGVIETRVASAPLIPFRELTKPLRAANNIVLLFSAALFPMWFVSSLYMQQVLGLSPLHTGLIFLPMTVMIMVVASRAGKLVSRLGVRAVLGAGLLMMTTGMLLLSKIGASGSAALHVMLPGPDHSSGRALWRFAPGTGAAPAATVSSRPAVRPRGAPIGASTTSGAYSFLTAPTLHPSVIHRIRGAPTGQLAPGFIFTANFYDLNEPPIVGQSGPLILDRRLEPVWFQPVPEKVVAANLSLQSYHGRPALAWWQGAVNNTGATASGGYVVVDQHYQAIARLKAKDGWVLTLHELLIDGDHAWVTANKNIAMNLSKYGGAYNGALIDSAVQEYDLKTGKLLRNWDALDHIPLSESRASLPTNGFPWDAYHVNSVQLTGNRSFLVSMRDTWAAYLVDIDTGRIEWSLGGRRSSFKF